MAKEAPKAVSKLRHGSATVIPDKHGRVGRISVRP